MRREGFDVDLFFDDEKGKLVLLEPMDVKKFAAAILGVKTGIATRDSLNKRPRPQIDASAVSVSRGSADVRSQFGGPHPKLVAACSYERHFSRMSFDKLFRAREGRSRASAPAS